MLTEDIFRKTLDIERRPYPDDSAVDRSVRNEPGPRAMTWLVIALIIVVAVFLFFSDAIPLLFLLLVGSLVANYLVRRWARSNAPVRNERYGYYIY